MIVAKFGGTSVADAEAIGRLIEIVRSRAGSQPVVVVSALARVTDALLALAHQCGSGDGAAIDAAVAALLERHESIARSLPGCSAAVDPIAADAAELRREVIAAQDRRLSPAELDAVAGRGELWSSRLVAAAMAGAGLAADWVDIRSDPGNRRPLRASHPLHPGAEQAGSRPPEAAGRGGTHSGDAGLHRGHGHRGGDHAGPGRLGLHRRAARCGARGRAGRDLDRCGWVDDRRPADRSVGSHAPASRATRRPPSWPPSAPGFCIRPPPCPWLAPGSPS